MSFLDEYFKNDEMLVRAGAERIEIGRTYLNRPIFAYEIGCGGAKIIAQYAIHAREHITYFLAVRHARQLLENAQHGKGTIYIIPAVNVDGVALCLDGIDSAGEQADNLIELNKSADFSLWKANARGVDLNVNFFARWGTGKFNSLRPGSQNYIGSSPNSESETQALVAFTKRISPDITLSWHAKGEVIYYDFYQDHKTNARDRKFAKIIANSTGYKITPSGKSAGGYKDWCIENLKISAVTIEVGEEKWTHPINIDKLPQIWQKTASVYGDLLAYFEKLNYNNK